MSCSEACATCARLRREALAIVGRDGLDALSLERVCRQAQLPPARFRAHYPTVELCLYATYEEISRSVYADFAAAFAREESWYDGLTIAGRTLLARMAARPAEARLCFVEIFRGDHELRRRRDAARRRQVGPLVRELGQRGDRPRRHRGPDRQPARAQAPLPCFRLRAAAPAGC